MKRILFFILGVFFFSAKSYAQLPDSVYLFCYFTGTGDGLHYACSEDGYTWNTLFDDSTILKPTVSKDKLMRDPCIIYGSDNQFHLVWTVSWNDKGIGYASSPDLLHWSQQKFIPVMAKEDSARNAWAPEITQRGRKYYIYWASTISGRFPLKDTAAESRYNHRIYYTITKNFRKFSKTRLLFDPGYSVIDATIIPHGKGFLMFFKNETRAPVEKNIRMAAGRKINGPYNNISKPITGNYWAEGPAVLKYGNKWIVYFDKYREHKYGAVESTDLVDWKDVSDKLEFPKGARHGTVITIHRDLLEKIKSYKIPD
jgi:GH43 family beta-xylosidase